MNRRTILRAVVLGAALLQPLAGAAADGVKLPAFRSMTLANGAQVALVEKRDTPLVSMSVSVRGGALGDPPGKDGTASLFADLMQKGAGARNAAEFAAAIEDAGGALNAAADTESLVVSASFLARDAGLMLELVADALQRPRLAEQEFARARTLAVQSIAAARDSDPRALIGTYGDAWLFRGHPYGRPVGGSESSLAGITADDVRQYYADHVGGDRLVIVVVGDFDAATMLPQLERAFGGWRKSGAGIPVAAAPAKTTGRRVLLVDKPGATQTYFWLGNVGASRTDPGRVEQNVVRTAFGGRFTSMLNSELRIKSGLTYGASAAFDRGLQPGAFSITSYTETGTTAQALDLALETLARLHRDGLDAEQLRTSRTYMLGQFPTTLETNGQIAARIADLLFYGLGPEDVDQYAGRVASVDEAAVRRAIAGAYAEPADLAIVLIGDAARIREVARRYGPVTEIRISDPRFTPQ